MYYFDNLKTTFRTLAIFFFNFGQLFIVKRKINNLHGRTLHSDRHLKIRNIYFIFASAYPFE